MSTKDQAVAVTAAELRMSDNTVRMVVDTYERARSAANRAKSGKVQKPKPVGGGVYLLADGSKVRGKAEAAAAAARLAGNGGDGA